MPPEAVHTLSILLAGVVVVIGGILALRLHAFLALVLAALVVAWLTPPEKVRGYALDRDGFVVDSIEGDEFRFAVPKGRPPLEEGMKLYVLPDASAKSRCSAVVTEIETTQDESGRSRRTATARVRDDCEVEPGAYAITASAYAGVASLTERSAIDRVTDGFGSTAGSIGILIAMASIIGKCLLDSGAADRVVRSALNLFGESAAPAAFIVSGFALGIPVFFDTVFYLMIPLGKAMRTRTGRNYLLYVLSIVAGATMAHSLVPPTPGPLFVAEELGVNLGTMILGGMIVGAFTAGFGLLYAAFANRLWDLPLRPSAELSLEQLEEIAAADESELPPLWLSLLPIVLPVVLIAGYAVLDNAMESPPEILEILGDKNIALIISAAIAMLTLVFWKRTSREDLLNAVGSSLASGGVIILITSAGGAFGGVLKETGVAGLIEDLPESSPTMIVTLAFLITTAVRTAQGSATVAMITAVGILAGLATGGGLGFHPVYLALAIGCGSKPVAWMNDSGFWVITKMSGMTEAEGLKYITPMTTLMGLVGLVVVLIGVTFFPMA